MPSEDAAITKLVKREVARRCIDISRTDIKVSHGFVYLRGEVRKLRGYDFDLREEIARLKRILQQRPGVRRVFIEDLFYK